MVVRLTWRVPCALLLVCAAMGASAAAGPPGTRTEPTFATHFGATVKDPYRWLEALHAPETRAWFTAQDRYTRDVLATLPGRAALRERIDTLTGGTMRVLDAQFGGGRVFYLKRAADGNQLTLQVRNGLEGTERLLVDATRFDARGEAANIEFYSASPNGQRVAYGISLGGAEVAILHVIDVDTGREVGMPIPRMSIGDPVSWRIDSGALFFTQLNDVPADADPTRRFRDEQLWMRDYGLGGRITDRRLLGRGFDVPPDVQQDDALRMHTGASSWAVVSVVTGNANAASLYVAPIASLRQAHVPWRKLLDAQAGVTRVALRGEWIYLLTNAGASNGRIVRWPLATSAPFDLAHAEVVLPASQRVVTTLGAARDALYVVETEAGYSRLRRLEYNVKLARAASGAGSPRTKHRAARAPKGPAAMPKVAGVARATDIALPFAGTIDELVTDPARNGALVALAGWTEPMAWMSVDGKGLLTRTPLLPVTPSALADIAVTRVMVRARDGTAVPVTLLQRQNAAHDGEAPLMLYAYGAYGISLTPGYSPSRMAWLERGGVLAFAHVRGGGELGEDWHRAGMLGNKPNTWHDLIDVAQWLVEQRWTSPARLAIRGGSAGGIAVGNAIIERPDLFRVMISEVGVHDMLRAEASANGPSDVPETGNIEDEAGFRALLAMSSYQRVQSGVTYPGALLTTGYNDPRVDAWGPGKMAAQLQAAAASVGDAARPVLLRVDFGGGHGIGATREQANAELADIYAFTLWQVGDAAFQPAAR